MPEQKKKSWKVNIPIEYTSMAIEYIVVGAYESACGYWLRQIGDIKEDGDVFLSNKPEGMASSVHISNLLQERKELWIIDSEGDYFTLTLKKLLKGIQRNHKLRPWSDSNEYDDEDYDCIMQLAIYGKFMYS